MAAKAFTDISIKHLKPGPVRREVPDPGARGLYCVVQPSGRKGFALRYRHNSVPRKLTLPAGISLAAARKLAADALYQVAQGIDPAEAKKAAAVNAAVAKANTVVAVCEEYLKREGKRLRTVDQRVSIFRRLVYPAIGDRPIDSVRRSDLVKLLDRIEDKSGERMADVTLAALTRVFNWHATRSDEFRSPVVRGMGRQDVKAHRRDRVLTDDELRKVWTAASATDGPFGVLVKFLLLTTARRNEAAAMRWPEVGSDGVWTLPPSRSKTKVEVVRPLSKAAQALLDEQPRILNCDFAFTSNGHTAITSFSGPKARLDAESGVTGWRLHDLRRTSRSLLSRAGVNSDVAERCLGHAMPVIRGIYDKHPFVDEMRHAFEALAALIERIVDPQPNVLALRH
jgi:integrase